MMVTIIPYNKQAQNEIPKLRMYIAREGIIIIKSEPAISSLVSKNVDEKPIINIILNRILGKIFVLTLIVMINPIMYTTR